MAALEVLESLLEVSPDDGEGRLRWGVNLARTGKHSEAAGSLRLLLEVESEDWIAQVATQELARALTALGETAEAIQILQSAAEKWPEQPSMRIQLAWLLDRARESAQAEEWVSGLIGDFISCGGVCTVSLSPVVRGGSGRDTEEPEGTVSQRRSGFDSATWPAARRDGKPMRCSWCRAGFLLAGLVISSQVAAFTVFIDHPTFLEPALGEVEVVARVESREPVRSLALFVDGRPQAILESAPYRWIVDVGEKNVQHLFQVVATSPSGETAEAVVETPRLQVDEQVDLELQQLYVTVTREGRAVEDLTRSQFAIEDRGESQELVTFERGDIPLTAVLLLDVSASMSGAELEMALSSSRAFIEGLQPLDQTMLLMFSDRIIRATDFTGFREVLTAALSNVTATGATALNDYLYVGLKQLERQQGRRVVLLLSDGIDSASVLEHEGRAPVLGSQPFVGLLAATAGTRCQDLLGLARCRGLSQGVGPVGGSGDSQRWSNSRSGGVEDAAEAFADVLEELRGQYVLGYYPTTRADDGRGTRSRFA